MTPERRYGEAEVEAIFGAAAGGTEPGRPALPDDRGMTLAEIQEVGREVGMEPARIAAAARALDTQHGAQPRERFLGVPVSVGRTVDLPRDLTDREWDILVGELRDTFKAKGRVTTSGGIREWSNGNLHISVEPTATGHRLRMGTHRGSAKPLLSVGAAGVIFGIILTTLFFFEELGNAQIATALLITFSSLGVWGSNVLRLPRWAREREDQMEHIAGRVMQLVEGG